MDRKVSGFFAEDYAAKLLTLKGYKILKRNFWTPFAEVDIIATKDRVLVFVEVKARWSSKFGKPEEAVNFRKLERIRRAGELFALQNKKLFKKMRIDVVSLVFEKNKLVSQRIINVF